MHTITEGHRSLLNVIVQLACHAAMATTKERNERVPEDLKDLMRALQHVHATSVSLHDPVGIIDSCAPALIFLARHEPDLFPKTFARSIVHVQLESLRLWNIACGVDGLNVEGIEIDPIADAQFGRLYLWNNLCDRTPNATELLIAPPIFDRILDAYEERIEQKRATNM
jgi:hypothetical protein